MNPLLKALIHLLALIDKIKGGGDKGIGVVDGVAANDNAYVMSRSSSLSWGS